MSAAERCIYTLRHAAIDFGKDHIIAGRLDPPLSREGIEQIEAMRTAGLQLDYERVIASPQRRALDTALRVTGLTADQVITSDLCMERDYGHLQGLLPSERDRIRPRTYYVSVGGVEHSLNPPGGETMEQLRERAADFQAYLQEISARNLLVVSHGTFLQQLHGFMRGHDVYHALEHSVTYLELNAFRFRAGELVSEELIYTPKAIEEPW